MFNVAYHVRNRWLDDLRLAYWRLMVRAARYVAQVRRTAKRVKAGFAPIRDYLWVPILMGLFGMVLGMVYAIA